MSRKSDADILIRLLVEANETLRSIDTRIELIRDNQSDPAASKDTAKGAEVYRCDFCGRDYTDAVMCCERRRDYLAAHEECPKAVQNGRKLPEGMSVVIKADGVWLQFTMGARTSNLHLGHMVAKSGPIVRGTVDEWIAKQVATLREVSP